MASVRSRGGDRAGAIELYTRALAAQPAFSEAYYNLGFALQKGGDASAATQALPLMEVARETSSSVALWLYGSVAVWLYISMALWLCSSEVARETSPVPYTVLKIEKRKRALHAPEKSPIWRDESKRPTNAEHVWSAERGASAAR